MPRGLGDVAEYPLWRASGVIHSIMRDGLKAQGFPKKCAVRGKVHRWGYAEIIGNTVRPCTHLLGRRTIGIEARKVETQCDKSARCGAGVGSREWYEGLLSHDLLHEMVCATVLSADSEKPLAPWGQHPQTPAWGDRDLGELTEWIPIDLHREGGLCMNAQWGERRATNDTRPCKMPTAGQAAH